MTLLGLVVVWLGMVVQEVGCRVIQVACTDCRPANVYAHEQQREWGAYFNSVAVLLWSVAGLLLGMSELYFIGMLILSVHLGWKVWLHDLSEPGSNMDTVKGEISVGLIFIASYLAGNLTPP